MGGANFLEAVFFEKYFCTDLFTRINVPGYRSGANRLLSAPAKRRCSVALLLAGFQGGDEGGGAGGGRGREMKRERQPSAILARVEMLASVVLDAYAVSTEPEPLEAEPPTIPPKQRMKLAKTAKKQKVQPSPRPAAEELAEVRPAASEGSCSTEASDLEPAPVPDSVPEPLQPLKHLRDCPPPSIDELRAAGYLETEDTVRRVWSWAKEHEPTDMVWPTPTAGVQEALRFDACGWPNGKTTTIDQWLGMIQYWTVLREQLITGAPRRARNSVNLGRR